MFVGFKQLFVMPDKLGLFFGPFTLRDLTRLNDVLAESYGRFTLGKDCCTSQKGLFHHSVLCCRTIDARSTAAVTFLYRRPPSSSCN